MNKFIIKSNVFPDEEKLLKLYHDVSWHAYVDRPKQLVQAIKHSLKVWTVWDKDKLIGLARVVGDGYSIIYIQDILVLKDYQRRGIGSRLLKSILKYYQSVRQIVLLTENREETTKFYEKNGLKDVSQYHCIAFMK